MRDAMGACAALNGTVWGTRTLRVELAHERGRRPAAANHGNTIFVGNLSFAVSEDELRAAIAQQAHWLDDVTDEAVVPPAATSTLVPAEEASDDSDVDA